MDDYHNFSPKRSKLENGNNYDNIDATNNDSIISKINDKDVLQLPDSLYHDLPPLIDCVSVQKSKTTESLIESKIKSKINCSLNEVVKIEEHNIQKTNNSTKTTSTITKNNEESHAVENIIEEISDNSFNIPNNDVNKSDKDVSQRHGFVHLDLPPLIDCVQKSKRTESLIESKIKSKKNCSLNEVDKSDEHNTQETKNSSTITKNNEESHAVEIIIEKISDNSFILPNNDVNKSDTNEENDINLPSTSSDTTNQIKFSNTNKNSIKKRNYRTRTVSSSSSSSVLTTNESIRLDDPVQVEITASFNESSNTATSLNSNIAITDDSNASSNFSYEDDSDPNPDPDPNLVQDILNKEKPKYNMNLTYEIMNREHGLCGYGYGRNNLHDSLIFQNSVRSSRHTIEKMKLLHKLKKHRGCVNSLNFNKSGQLLCTGSDDLKICVWNWSANKLKYSFQSGHQSNVFQTKFIDNQNGINIVSSGRDGEVRFHKIPPSGGLKVNSTNLCKHSGAVHRIAICPTNTNEILSAGDDGNVIRSDLRQLPTEKIVKVRNSKGKLSLYSISHNPLDEQFCVAGRDKYVYVYDKKNMKKPIYKMTPNHIEDKPIFYITCAIYNQSGSEILASYSGEEIYLFNNKNYINGSYLRRYRGRSDHKTIKGVNFFGPNSEYIVSGSDCGNLFFWDKNTETIVNWMKGDEIGIVNCLDPHPSFPILATSGLDYDAKIWAPINENYPPKMEGLDICLRDNLRKLTVNSYKFLDERTFFFFVRQYFRNNRQANDNNDNLEELLSTSSSENDDFDPNSNDGSESNFTDRFTRDLPCAMQ